MNQNKTNKSIYYLILFCVFIFMVRVKITGSLSFLFLIWNLFLAFVPFAISSKLKSFNLKKISKIKTGSMLFLWLIFLPNAPYIITDFIHLNNTNSPIVWLDILLLFTFAATGLLLAIISLQDIYTIIKQKWNLKFANYFSYVATFLCGFGIYLGRFLRLNSWDIFTSPIEVLKMCFISFSDKRSYLITFGFGVFMWLLLSVYKNMNTTNNVS